GCRLYALHRLDGADTPTYVFMSGTSIRRPSRLIARPTTSRLSAGRWASSRSCGCEKWNSGALARTARKGRRASTPEGWRSFAFGPSWADRMMPDPDSGNSYRIRGLFYALILLGTPTGCV